MFTNEHSQSAKLPAACTRNKPTRPRSAYNIFFHEERSRIIINALKTGELTPKEASKILSSDVKRYRRKHGKIGRSEITKIISSKWKNFSSEDKLKYEIAAEKDMERCREELKAWKEAQQQDQNSYCAAAVASGCTSQVLMNDGNTSLTTDDAHTVVGLTEQHQQQRREETMIPSVSQDSITASSSVSSDSSSGMTNAIFDHSVLETLCKNEVSPKLAQLLVLQNMPNLFTSDQNTITKSADNESINDDDDMKVAHEVENTETKSSEPLRPLLKDNKTQFQLSLNTLASQLDEDTTEFIISSFKTH